MSRSNVTKMLVRLVVDDAGQDLIEYALLSGFIGLGGFVVFSELADTMHTAYDGWITAVYAVSGDTPPPSSP
jgi:Flp pilus assembly pilin Flp